ncbi:SDR family oxidoreductase [Streptomyces cacaoi]|uniref:SDR family oxidoreductase n=1 Tax=Streptomyces cacaoi TaxID=1898 RepID=UPI00261EF6C9|nr:SDR family oxidoreductase [Streptomyces cacaoi]
MSTVAITGSSSGMGAALAARFTAQGHRVIGIDLRGADIEADLGTEDGRALAVERLTDLSDGRLDGFLPFAGLSSGARRRPSLLVSVNYFGAVRLLEGVRPLLAAAGTSAVVLASSNSTTTQPGWHPELAEACLAGDEAEARRFADAQQDEGAVLTYPATKAALAYYVRTRAADYIVDGVRLNAVAPGFIDTPMTRAGREDPQVAAAMDDFLASIPAGRAGQPEEVVEVVDFLMSERASYCVGSVLFCDGGLDAKLRGTDWPSVRNPGS